MTLELVYRSSKIQRFFVGLMGTWFMCIAILIIFNADNNREILLIPKDIKFFKIKFTHYGSLVFFLHPMAIWMLSLFIQIMYKSITVSIELFVNEEEELIILRVTNEDDEVLNISKFEKIYMYRDILDLNHLYVKTSDEELPIELDFAIQAKRIAEIIKERFNKPITYTKSDPRDIEKNGQ